MKLSRTLFAIIGALALVAGVTHRAHAADPNDPTKNYLGLNTWFSYGERPFADIFHGGSVGYLFDTLGPKADFIQAWAIGTNAGVQLGMNGTYNLQFTGQAIVTSPYLAPVSISTPHWDSSSNISTATVTVSYPDDTQVPKSIWLKFTHTQRQPGDFHTGLTHISLTYPASVTVDTHLMTPYQNNTYATSYPATDADGWPQGDFMIKSPTAPVGTLGGTYTLSFTGTTTSVVPSFNGFSIGPISYNAGTNTSTGTVTVSSSSSSDTLAISFIGAKRDRTSNPPLPGLTNVHLYRPGYNGTELFSTEYKTIMGKSDVIRFMDWNHTNYNPSVAWSDRCRPAGLWDGALTAVDANQLPIHGWNGVPYEAMVKLCNELNTDLYVTVPPRVDDAYVTNLAKLIKYGSDGVNPYSSTQTNPVWPPLNSNLKIYVEYANEIWNDTFEAYHDSFNTVNLQVKNGVANYPIDYDKSNPSTNVLKNRYVAYRSSQISLLFRSVFGDSAMPGTATDPNNPRVRPLFEGQEGFPGNQLSPGLEFLETFYSLTGTSNSFNPTVRPVSSLFYGGGGAAYYGITGVGSSTSPDPSVVFQAGTTNPIYVGPTFIPVIYCDSLWVNNFGMKRVAYEGGETLPTQTATWTNDAEWRLNTDSRMVDVEQQFHDTWTQGGGVLLNYYTHGDNSQWGFAQAFDNFTSGKLLGLDNIHTHTRPQIVTEATVIQGSASSPVTGSVPIYSLAHDDKYHLIQEGGATFFSTPPATPEPTLNGITAGKYIAFGVEAPVAATYSSVIRYLIYNTATCTVSVYVNGALSSTQVLPGTSNAMGNSTPFNVFLPAGFSVVRLAVTTGGFAVASENFTLADVTSGLVARWNFDSNTTDTAPSDAISDNGTLVGSPSYVTLTGTNIPVGTAALILNGTSQCMTVPSSADINLTSACSMTAWVKIANATENAYRMILSKRAAYGDTAGYELMYQPSLQQLILRSGGSYLTYSLNQPLALDTNWHHIAVTINGSTATFYKDGVALTGATGTVGNPLTNTQGLAIGGRRNGTIEYPWNGQLDDVRIYSRAITPSDVTAIFAQEQ